MSNEIAPNYLLNIPIDRNVFEVKISYYTGAFHSAQSSLPLHDLR
jgi:hypothetical protein